MYWKWDKDSVLNKITKYTQPKSIFMDVCTELGRYYQEKGFKFTKSMPKLIYRDGDIKLEIRFSTSHYNRAENFVNLEIISTFFYMPYIKSNVKGKGILFGHSDISSEYDMDKNDIQCKLVEMDGTEIIFKNCCPKERVRYAHTCNIYDIDVEKFSAIIGYIDIHIIPWVHKIQTDSGVEAMIALKRAQRPDWNLKNSNDYVNCSFAYYVCEKFPDIAKKFEIDTFDVAI